MTFVPDEAGIEVEALVENKDIGFVHEGQEVAIKLDAFPFTRYGLVPGTVRKLGRDAATPQQVASAFGSAPSGTPPSPSTASGDFSYPARVALAQDWIMVDGKRESIRSGMHVSAEVKIGDAACDRLRAVARAPGRPGSGTGEVNVIS